MPRIRSIKPEFFSSADICALTPLARLLYVALWCEADREGRFVYKPATFKLRYFPGDNCDINELLAELADAGLLARYEVSGCQYAYIPAFTKHQVINNREAESVLPSAADARKPPRVVDASGTRESGELGEGKEGKGREGSAREHAHKLPDDFWLSDDMREYIRRKAPQADPDAEFEQFCNHHRAKGSRMKDWKAAWRTWAGNAEKWGGKGQGEDGRSQIWEGAL